MSTVKDIKTLLNKSFGSGEMSRDGVNYCIRCPECKDSRRDKRKLVVRLDDGRYHCWVCGTKGSNIVRLIGKFRPDLVQGFRVSLRKEKEDLEHKEEQVELPQGVVLLGDKNQNDPDLKASVNYLKRRGLKKKDLMRWRVLSCRSGSFRRRVIIPSFDKEGNLNYYVARTIDAEIKMKYQNSKVSKEEIIFNEIDLDWSKEMVLVEGVFDAIKCPENTVPILGSSLSTRSKLYKMLSRNQTPCIVSLDPDLKRKAFKLADLLASSGCRVKIAFAPPGKDLGDMTKTEAMSILSNATEYSDMMRITHKIREIKSGSLF